VSASSTSLPSPPAKLNPNQLPSGTNVYFLVLIITSWMFAFWSGQFLPGLDYFTTPFAAPIQPGINFTRNGLYGIAIWFVCTAFFFAYHTTAQRRLFGAVDELQPQHPLWGKLGALSLHMGAGVRRLLLDKNIMNADAIAFGFRKNRTILMGKGLLWLASRRPSDFMARMAHELGHFKNGDVKYAFLSRAMFQANVLLMLVVLVWLCFVPARVVLMNYYLFTAPAVLPENHIRA